MPSLYEGIGLITDKQAVVLDLGHRYTKFGFAGEASPRCIVPSEVKNSETGEVRAVLNYKDEEDLYSLLVDFLHMLYFKYVLVNPKDRRVVVVESLLCPTVIRDTLAKVLFRHFEVSSVMFVPSHLVSLATLGVGTGLIVDVGHQEALLIPVYEGVPVLRLWQAQPLAGAAIELRLREQLMSWYTNKESASGDNIRISQDIANLPDCIIEDIKVRGCFVTTLERGNKLAEEETPEPPVPDFDYRVGGDKVIRIPGPVREAVHEVLFEKDNDQMSLPHMILDAIQKSAIDMRKPLAGNIVLVGGTTMVPGFKSRLLAELRELMKTPKYENSLKISTFKFHSPPAKENYVAWLGGAIFGSTDVITVRSLTKAAYLNLKSVPDWSSLVHNRLDITKLTLM